MGTLLVMLGDYTVPFLSILIPLPCVYFCVFLFAHRLDRRKLFPLRLILVLAVLTAAFWGLTVLRTNYSNIITRLIVYIFTYCSGLVIIEFCYADRPTNRLLAWCGATATQCVVSMLFPFLILLAGNDPLESMTLFRDSVFERDLGIMLAIQFAASALVYFIFRGAKPEETDRESAAHTVSLSIVASMLVIVVHGFSREYMMESRHLYYIISANLAVMSLFVLLLRTGILSQNRYRQEIATTERVLREERRQYDSIKENIEIVNMRCHDLKHQLEDLSYKLTEDELARLKDAIKIYDSSVKTGSEVLDVVIYEKQLVFDKEGIRFTVMADGAALGFMRTTHVYALFNNALGNALEAVRRLPDPEKKIIDLSVKKSGGELVIAVTNYFTGEADPEKTTKKDKKRHGLGMKSMRYIAEQYGGTLRAEADGEVFELTVRIPLPAEK